MRDQECPRHLPRLLGFSPQSTQIMLINSRLKTQTNTLAPTIIYNKGVAMRRRGRTGVSRYQEEGLQSVLEAYKRRMVQGLRSLRQFRA